MYQKILKNIHTPCLRNTTPWIYLNKTTKNGKIKILQCQLLGNKFFFFFSLETMSSEFFEKIKFREKQDTTSPDCMDMQRDSHHDNKEKDWGFKCGWLWGQNPHVYGLNCVLPPKKILKSSPPSACAWTLIWNTIFPDDQVKMRS